MTAREGRILKADQTRPPLWEVDDDYHLLGDNHHTEPGAASGCENQYGPYSCHGSSGTPE